jgi:hypothetical protein
MGTINGCGTMFYGWRHNKEDSTATKWFTLFYIPIIPLGRSRLRALTDFEKEKFFSSPGALAAAIVGYGSRTDLYQIKERLPLDGLSVLLTYLKAYLLLPLLVAWPILLMVAIRGVFGVHPEWENAEWFKPALIAFVGVTLFNAIAVPMWSIQRARGYRGGLFTKKAGPNPTPKRTR